MMKDVRRMKSDEDEAPTDSEVGKLRGQVGGDEPMPQNLVELVQGGLLLHLCDGVWRYDLVLKIEKPTNRDNI